MASSMPVREVYTLSRNGYVAYVGRPDTNGTRRASQNRLDKVGTILPLGSGKRDLIGLPTSLACFFYQRHYSCDNADNPAGANWRCPN